MTRQGNWQRKTWEDLTSGVPLSTDNGTGDSFGRLRIANPTTLFDSQLQYDKQPLLWDEKLAGSATSTHSPNDSSVDMTVTTADGDSVIRQTRDYHRYQPGKSQFILCTGVLGSAQENTNKLIGYGDAENGVFFGQDGGGNYVLLRSKSTGTVSDARKVYQSEWNIDTMDKYGPSGITFDPTKTNIFIIDIEWLGVGRVRLGLNIDGVTYYVHEFLNANTQSTTYMTTANLPVRYEITNTGTAASSSTLKQICSSVISEGGVDKTAAYPFSVELLDVAIPNGVENAIVIFAARPALTFNGITNRARFEPTGYEVLAEGGKVVAQILYDPVLTGGTWATTNAASFIEGNSTVTSFSGGIDVGSSIITGGSRAITTPVFGKTVTSRLPFGLGIDADDPTTLALVCYATAANVTASFTFQWEELR